MREPLYCVVTDTDIHRIWAPSDPRSTPIRFLAPCAEVADRLYAYGVPAAQVRMTGFPLPDALVGGRERSAAKEGLRRRLGRLDPLGTFAATFQTTVEAEIGLVPEAPGPIGLTFAVGGAGTQVKLAEGMLRAVAPLVHAGELTLVLVAGTRAEAREALVRAARASGLERHLGQAVRVLFAEDVQDYLAAFTAVLLETDLLVTKPSELTFYAALGLPLLLAPAVGVHEERNQQWVTQFGAALDLPDIQKLGWWLRARLGDGSLARAAWNGYSRLESRGLYAIVDLVSGGWT